jgi:ribosomal RNA-processing protein 17
MPGRGMASNIQLLTHAHKIVKAKKRQKREQVKAVVFDEDARRCAFIRSFSSFLIIIALCPSFSREFLTGFHKRKLAKKEEGKKKAQAREKQQRLEARREVRMFCLSAFAPQNWISKPW